MDQYIGITIFFGILMIISWITSAHWAKKYNQLLEKVGELKIKII